MTKLYNHYLCIKYLLSKIIPLKSRFCSSLCLFSMYQVISPYKKFSYIIIIVIFKYPCAFSLSLFLSTLSLLLTPYSTSHLRILVLGSFFCQECSSPILHHSNLCSTVIKSESSSLILLSFSIPDNVFLHSICC